MVTILGGFAIYIIAFLVVLTVLVFVHEYGHYWVARRNGVKVEVFSIGFGPEIAGFNDRAGTRWKFSAIPLGGYVRMFGDSNEASMPGETSGMSEEERSVSFHHKAVWRRALIVAAGPAANFLFAILVLAGLYLTYGQPFTPPTVGQVQSESAAEAAGMEPGDTVLSIDGRSIDRFEQMQQIIRLNPGTPVELVVERGGEQLTLTVEPQVIEVDDGLGGTSRIGLLGVSREGVEFRSLNPVSAVWNAGIETVSIAEASLTAVGQIITGNRNVDELGGPVRIAQMSGEVAQIGFSTLIWFMALLSINLGLINLFPVPMLDGGHLVFYAIEAIRGRPVSERAMEYSFRFGFAIVITLMIFVTWNDLVQLRVFQFFTDLFS